MGTVVILTTWALIDQNRCGEKTGCGRKRVFFTPGVKENGTFSPSEKFKLGWKKTDFCHTVWKKTGFCHTGVNIIRGVKENGYIYCGFGSLGVSALFVQIVPTVSHFALISRTPTVHRLVPIIQVRSIVNFYWFCLSVDVVIPVYDTWNGDRIRTEFYDGCAVFYCCFACNFNAISTDQHWLWTHV